MTQIKMKPIIVLGKRGGRFRRPDGSLEVVTDEEVLVRRVAELSRELRAKLRYSAALLEDTILRTETDLAQLEKNALGADALLVYLVGTMPLHTLYQWQEPIVAFSGQYAPYLALHAFGVQRQNRAGITIALDFQDIDEQIRILDARKKLHNSRIVLLGLPAPQFSRWQHLPDLELAREKLGVEFSPLETREFVAQLPMINSREAEILAERWLQEAKEIVEPTKADVVDSARIFLALSDMLQQRKANAIAISCLELMDLKVPPPCYAMSRLRDEGATNACEGDVIALLSMMLLGYLADEPAFMGNIISADPETNILTISHCVVPSKMAGFSQPPKPYILRNRHGINGVTAHVELDTGQEVTMARLARDLNEIVLIRGELVDCRDTTHCRTTLSVRVNDVREFVQCALGNHHALVYGNLSRQARTLSQKLGINAIEL